MTCRATALVGLGANLGDLLANLRAAVAQLRAGVVRDTTVVGCSAVHESEAMGAPGPNFFNAVVALDTSLAPPALLAGLHAIEHALGRVRRERWEPRVIDLDLLAWITIGEVESVRCSGELELPHPRIVDRDFVLIPLLELRPGLILEGRSIAAHLQALPPKQRTVVRRVDAVL